MSEDIRTEEQGRALAKATLARARALSDPGLADMLSGAASALLDESKQETTRRACAVLHAAALVMVVAAERLTVRRG